jgi:hypothetical protein
LHVPSGSEAENTKRLIRAAENKFVHIIAHPTGRLLLEREPYPVNVQAVIDACAATGTWMELNCNPHRFDLDWRHWPYAKSKGVKCVINPDAHRNEHAGFLRLGAGVARKGWLEQTDVVNTLTLKPLLKELKQTSTRVMKKIFVSLGLAAVGTASLHAAYAPDSTDARPRCGICRELAGILRRQLQHPAAQAGQHGV